jgi:hypothetical protein
MGKTKSNAGSMSSVASKLVDGFDAPRQHEPALGPRAEDRCAPPNKPPQHRRIEQQRRYASREQRGRPQVQLALPRRKQPGIERERRRKVR